MENTILKVLVGSRAHGLNTPNSDWDFRGVFVTPTAELLKIGGTTQQTNWIEGVVDDTSWEIGHFLKMATKCNPTILEVFLSPAIDNETNLYGEEMRGLFDKVWNSKDVMNAFIGYGMNQRKKFLDEKDKRPNKYAAAYARSLYNAFELLTTGTFTVRIADVPGVGPRIRDFKDGNYTYGEVIDFCREWEEMVRRAYSNNPDKETDMEAVNEFLLRVRKSNF